MRNKRLLRTLSAFCLTMVVAFGFTIPAFAQGSEQAPAAPAEDSTNDSNVIVEETEPALALTPEGNAALVQAEPYGSEKVTYDGSDDHADKLDPWFTAVVDYQSGNDCHYDKSDDISACRTCQFGRTACESGEYRETDETEQKVDQIADGSFFPSEKIQGQIDCQIGE